MKKLLIVAFAAIAVVACKQGNKSDALTADMTAFESKWDSVGTVITNWKGALDNTTAEVKAMNDSSKSWAAGKSIDSTLVANCDAHVKSVDDINAAYAGAVTEWTAQTEAYKTWKESFTKGEVKEEDANAKIAELQGTLTDWESKVAGWNGALEKVKTDCMTNCEAVKKAVEESAAAPAKKK